MPHKVLITDDDPAVRLALAQVLDEEGYHVVTAASGEEALRRLIEEAPFDMLLLDLNLSGKNGWDTFERVTAVNPLLPVVLITARSDQHALARAAGASALVEKPCDVARLIETIRELIDEPPMNRLRRVAGRQRSLRHLPAESEPLVASCVSS